MKTVRRGRFLAPAAAIGRSDGTIGWRPGLDRTGGTKQNRASTLQTGREGRKMKVLFFTNQVNLKFKIAARLVRNSGLLGRYSYQIGALNERAG